MCGVSFLEDPRIVEDAGYTCIDCWEFEQGMGPEDLFEFEPNNEW